MIDPALAVVAAYMSAMRKAFNPNDAEFPPTGGGTTNVRFFAGDAPALAAFEAHAEGTNCAEPFVWVRVTGRYRSTPRAFPKAADDTEPGCGAMRVVGIEVGVGRCSVTVQEQPTWQEYDDEADRALEDSYRIELALCIAATVLRGQLHTVATDIIRPYGPEGGVIAWLGTAAVDLLEEP